MPLVLNSSSITGLAAVGGLSSPQTGSVLQVVSANYSTQTTTYSSTYSDTGLNVSITPTSATSKILVFLNLPVFKETNNTSGGFKLVRNSTDLITIETLAGYTNSTASIGIGSVCSNYLDSPATTSSTNYKVQFKSMNNNAIIYICGDGYGAITATITAMEIAA